MKTNVAIIGFMGAGKTAVGQALAKKLKMNFIELDAIIALKAKKSIPQIFEQGGEIEFRELEMKEVKEVARERRVVIACGGGAVLNWINVERLKQTAVIVRLTASPVATLKRVSREVGQRPLLDVDDPLSRIREMIRFREPFYARAADITVKTTRITVDAVVEKIVANLREDASFDWPE